MIAFTYGMFAAITGIITNFENFVTSSYQEVFELITLFLLKFGSERAPDNRLVDS